MENKSVDFFFSKIQFYNSVLIVINFLLKKFSGDHFYRTNVHIKELSMTWRNSIWIIVRHFGD